MNIDWCWKGSQHSTDIHCSLLCGDQNRSRNPTVNELGTVPQGFWTRFTRAIRIPISWRVCLYWSQNQNICSRWVHRESNLMFTLSNDKDQRKKFAFVFAFTQCKWTLTDVTVRRHRDHSRNGQCEPTMTRAERGQRTGPDQWCANAEAVQSLNIVTQKHVAIYSNMTRAVDHGSSFGSERFVFLWQFRPTRQNSSWPFRGFS